MDFGFRSGKSRIRVEDFVQFGRYFEVLQRTGLKWFFLIGALLGFIVHRFIFFNADITQTWLSTLLVALLVGVMFSFPYFLLMEITGDRSIKKLIVFLIVTTILELVIASFIPVLALFTGIIAFVLGVGVLYPNRVTLVDAVILYIALGVIGLLLGLLVGVGAFLSPTLMAQSIIAP